MIEGLRAVSPTPLFFKTKKLKQMIQEIKRFLEFRKRVDKLLRSQSLQTLTNSYLLSNYADLVNEMEKWFKRLCPSLPFKTGCASCFADHFVQLKYLSINQIIDIMNVNHKIKDDFVAFIDGKIYTNKSPHLTNEICEKIFKKHGMVAFDNYDQNWRKKEINIEQFEKAQVDDTFVEFFEVLPEEKKAVLTVDNEEKLAEVVETVDLSGYSYKELQKLYKEKTGKSPVKLSKAKLIEELS
jgi:hypothetical protein